MKKIVSVLLLFSVLSLLLFSCENKPETPSNDDLIVRVSVLSGTTGFGMAPLMHSSDAPVAKLNYQFTLENDASNVTAGLINGSVDIAALPTNAAAVVYHKTQGGVKLLTINTKGVLYLLDNGNGITSFADLKGKTVAVPAQNPTFIFSYLCEQNGLRVGEDVIIDNTYSSPAELQSNVAAGNVTLAVLPEPMVTVTTSANEDVKIALDLTAEWNKVAPKDSLVQGCLVVRTAFAEAHPEIVATFLGEYGTSVNYLSENVQSAAEMIAEQGIFAKAEIAAKAIPRCNVCFMTGNEMKAAMNAFLEIMLQTNPASVGGTLPGDDFYYYVASEKETKK